MGREWLKSKIIESQSFMFIIELDCNHHKNLRSLFPPSDWLILSA